MNKILYGIIIGILSSFIITYSFFILLFTLDGSCGIATEGFTRLCIPIFNEIYLFSLILAMIFGGIFGGILGVVW